jgi:hypothetical protein
MKQGTLFLLVATAMVIAAAAGAGCTTQSIITKAGDFEQSTPPISTLPTASADTPPVSTLPTPPISELPTVPISTLPTPPLSEIPTVPVSTLPTPPVSQIPGAQISATPSAPAGTYPNIISRAESSPVRITIEREAADRTKFLITFVSGNEQGNIDKIDIGSTMISGHLFLKPQAGETLELKGSDNIERVMIMISLKDGTRYKYIDEEL